MSSVPVVYEGAPAGFDEQLGSIIHTDHGGYQVVAANSTDVPLTSTIMGAAGDYLTRLNISVSDSANCLVTIKDGAGPAIEVIPTGTPVGPYEKNLGMKSKSGGFSISTGTGAKGLAHGKFS